MTSSPVGLDHCAGELSRKLLCQSVCSRQENLGYWEKECSQGPFPIARPGEAWFDSTFHFSGVDLLDAVGVNCYARLCDHDCQVNYLSIPTVYPLLHWKALLMDLTRGSAVLVYGVV